MLRGFTMSVALAEEQKDDFIRNLLRHERQIYAFIRSLVPNAADAEDVLQEVSAVLWRKFDRFEPGTSFQAWALEVARHEVQSFRRDRAHDRLRFGDETAELLASIAAQESANLTDLERALSHCLGQLKPEARTLLDRRYQTDASVAAVAAEMGRPIQTVYSLLKRIRRALFECIQRTMAAEVRT